MSENVILPFDDDIVWEMIDEDKINNTTYTVNVKQSYDNLKNAFLYYISNLGLDVEFDWSNCDYETKSTILKDYLGLNRVYEQHELLITVGSLLMLYKQLGYDHNSFLTIDQAEQFINDNPMLIDRCASFVDSLMLYVGYQLKQSHEFVDISKYQSVKDNTIPFCLPALLTLPNFGAYYSIVNPNRFTWYEIQFTQPIYGGRTIDKYVLDKHSALAIAWNHVINEYNKNVSHNQTNIDNS